MRLIFPATSGNSSGLLLANIHAHADRCSREIEVIKRNQFPNICVCSIVMKPTCSWLSAIWHRLRLILLIGSLLPLPVTKHLFGCVGMLWWLYYVKDIYVTDIVSIFVMEFSHGICLVKFFMTSLQDYKMRTQNLHARCTNHRSHTCIMTCDRHSTWA
jgi:hypothetical protein